MNEEKEKRMRYRYDTCSFHCTSSSCPCLEEKQAGTRHAMNE